MIILDQIPQIRWFAEQRLNSQFGPCYTIANEKNCEICAVVIFSNFRKTSAEISFVCEGKRGINKTFLHVVFDYAFNFAKWRRLNALVSPDNFESIKIIEKSGFKKEGRIRKAADDGGDLLLYGLLREECRWVENQAADQPQALASTYH